MSLQPAEPAGGELGPGAGGEPVPTPASAPAAAPPTRLPDQARPGAPPPRLPPRQCPDRACCTHTPGCCPCSPFLASEDEPRRAWPPHPQGGPPHAPTRLCDGGSHPSAPASPARPPPSPRHLPPVGTRMGRPAWARSWLSPLTQALSQQPVPNPPPRGPASSIPGTTGTAPPLAPRGLIFRRCWPVPCSGPGGASQWASTSVPRAKKLGLPVRAGGAEASEMGLGSLVLTCGRGLDF